MSPSDWDTTNEVLYQLCRKHPRHTDNGEVLAKILLVGRAYAAAIERRRDRKSVEKNERYYRNTVAQAIQSSSIDRWLQRARAVVPGTPEALSAMVEIHGSTTRLFNEISGLQKRSLASKYLHFHVPELFYIYDSRAVNALREFSDVLPRARRSDGSGDNEYRKFAGKCSVLAAYCEKKLDLRPLPRHIDNLLLKINER
jgi:hypothetical protein